MKTKPVPAEAEVEDHGDEETPEPEPMKRPSALKRPAGKSHGVADRAYKYRYHETGKYGIRMNGREFCTVLGLHANWMDSW